MLRKILTEKEKNMSEKQIDKNQVDKFLNEILDIDHIELSQQVIGIRCKESNKVSGLVVTEDPAAYINEVRAAIATKPCAYSMFPEQYEFVIFNIDSEVQKKVEMLVKKDEETK